MRTLPITVFLLSLLVASAHAAVVDTLNCKITLTAEDGTEHITRAEQLALVRKPDRNEGGMRYTKANSGFGHLIATADSAYGYYIRIGSSHAFTAEGDVYHHICLALVSFECDKAICVDNIKKQHPLGSCGTPDPVKYGKQVAVEDGVPDFGEKRIARNGLTTIPGIESSLIECTHEGTYY